MMIRISTVATALLFWILSAGRQCPVVGQAQDDKPPLSILNSAERMLLLFHDDSNPSLKILSNFETTKEHFESTTEGSVTFLPVNASDASAEALKSRYAIMNYPTLKWVVHGVACDFLGGLRSVSMIKWITSRLENTVVFLDDDDGNSYEEDQSPSPTSLEQRLEDAKGSAELVVIGFFDSLHEIPPKPRSDIEAFIAVSQEDRGLECRFIAMEKTDKARAAAGVTSKESNVFAIHRYFGQEDAPIPFDQPGRVGRNQLHKFVEKNRMPLIPVYSDANAAAITHSFYHYYVFILVKSLNSQSTQTLLTDIMYHVASYFHQHEADHKDTNVRFVAVPYGDDSSKTLFRFFSHEPSDTPVLRMLSLHNIGSDRMIDPDHNIFKYDQPTDGYTIESVRSFVSRHLVTQKNPVPSPRDDAPSEIHGEEL